MPDLRNTQPAASWPLVCKPFCQVVKCPQIFAWTITHSSKTFSSAYIQDHCYHPGCMHSIKHGKMNFLSVILNWTWAQIHVPVFLFHCLFQPILPFKIFLGLLWPLWMLQTKRYKFYAAHTTHIQFERIQLISWFSSSRLKVLILY